MRFNSTGKYRLVLLFFSLLSAGLAFYATWPWGAGLSSDAVRNLSVSVNLLGGKGFFDLVDSPFVWWPPLYPVLLAFLAWVTRLDAFQVGWLLNILLGGMNVWLAGLIFERVFLEKRILAYLFTVFVAFSLPLIKIAANIASDPLFITLVLSFFLVLHDWDRKSMTGFTGLVLIVALCALQRLLGVVLIPVGALGILFAHKNNFWRGVWLATLFAALAVLPLVVWLLGHNYLLYGTVFGPRSYEDMLPWKNFVDSTSKILDWFYPYYSAQRLFPHHWIVFPLLFIVLLIVSGKKARTLWFKSFLRPAVWPLVVFSFVYFAVLLYTVDFYDQKFVVSDRYQVVILIPVLVMIGLTIEKLLLFHFDPASKVFTAIALVIFSIFMVYPVYGVWKYTTLSRQHGEYSYNLYNTRAFHESQVLNELKKILEDEPGATLYTNAPAAVWFFTGKTARPLPGTYNRWSKDEFKANMMGWPYEKSGFVIWFDQSPYDIFYAPEDLSLIADMYTVYQASDGTIYYVSAQNRP